MVARTDERGAASAADDLARRLRGDSTATAATRRSSDATAQASDGMRRRRQVGAPDETTPSATPPTHVRVPRTARRASVLQRILNSTGRAHLLERIKRERQSDLDDDGSDDSDDDDGKLPQTIRRRVSRIFLQRFLKKQDVACEADFCLYFELQARESPLLERSSSASIADWVRRRTSSSSVLAPSPSHVQDDALDGNTLDQVPATPRDADDTHTVIEITAMLLRDAGCQVMLYPLQHADSDVLPESKRDAQAYAMTIGYAEPSAHTTTDTSAIPLDRSVHHTLPPHHQKLPPYVTLHPAYTQQILPLAGYAQTQQLTKLILKECRADHNLSLASGDLVFQANTPILQQLAARSDVAVQLYPLHRDDFRVQMIRKWANDATYAPPLTDIYAYYGPKIAMYFAWLDFYTRMLVVPSIAGVVVAVAGHFHAESYSLLSFCLAIGTSGFVDLWRRKQREVEYTWKYQDVATSRTSAGPVTLSPGLDAIETRTEFQGEWMDDPVTHEVIYDFPRHKRLFRQLLALPLLLTMCCGVGAYVVGLNVLSENLRSHYRSCYLKHAASGPNTGPSSPSSAACAFITHGPGVLNALIIYIMDVLYQQLAWRLNEFENYRTAQEFEDNLVLKRMPFHFVNSNASICFLAFYVQDLDRVRERLWILMVAMQLLDNFKEVGLPFVVSLTGEFLTADGKRRRSHSRSDLDEDRAAPGAAPGAAVGSAAKPPTVLPTELQREHTSLASVQDRVARVLMQKRQAQYKDTFADYKEMMIQYGYVALYSPIFPLAPVFAWLNNVVESRSDFLKLVTTHSYQRPVVQHTRGIGVWEHVLVAFSGAAVIVNFALVWTYELDDLLPTWSDLHKFMFLVACEHLIFLIKVLLNWAAPDVPTWIQNEKRIAALHRTHDAAYAQHMTAVTARQSSSSSASNEDTADIVSAHDATVETTATSSTSGSKPSESDSRACAVAS